MMWYQWVVYFAVCAVVFVYGFKAGLFHANGSWRGDPIIGSPGAECDPNPTREERIGRLRCRIKADGERHRARMNG